MGFLRSKFEVALRLAVVLFTATPVFAEGYGQGTLAVSEEENGLGLTFFADIRTDTQKSCLNAAKRVLQDPSSEEYNAISTRYHHFVLDNQIEPGVLTPRYAAATCGEERRICKGAQGSIVCNTYSLGKQ